MPNNYRYSLEKGSKKFHCPDCGEKTFVRYKDAQTGQYLPDQYGRCDRESNCNYHLNPYKDGYGRGETNNKKRPYIPNRLTGTTALLTQQKPTDFITDNDFESTLNGYETNSFFRWLVYRFGNEAAISLIETYLIGTWKDRILFWQVDRYNNVRTGQAILYGADFRVENLKRNGTPSWAHKFLNYPEDFKLNQCFFGEHLLFNDMKKRVAVVESAKTALVCSLYYPDFVWLAASGSGGLNEDKLQVLKGREITLFPDLKQFDKWNEKALELSKEGFDIEADNQLEEIATDDEKNDGLDIADFVLRDNLDGTTYNHKPP